MSVVTARSVRIPLSQQNSGVVQGMHLAGVLHLASGLRERAEAWQPLRNAAAGGGADAEKPQALVTLHLEVAARTAGLRAAAPAPGAPVAELMVRRGWNGTLELAVAGQVGAAAVLCPCRVCLCRGQRAEAVLAVQQCWCGAAGAVSRCIRGGRRAGFRCYGVYIISWAPWRMRHRPALLVHTNMQQKCSRTKRRLNTHSSVRAATRSLICSGHRGPAQEAAERETGSKRGAKEEKKDMGALTKPWAWPLVNAEAPALARYEALARELVARHGLAGWGFIYAHKRQCLGLAPAHCDQLTIA